MTTRTVIWFRVVSCLALDVVRLVTAGSRNTLENEDDLASLNSNFVCRCFISLMFAKTSIQATSSSSKRNGEIFETACVCRFPSGSFFAGKRESHTIVHLDPYSLRKLHLHPSF